MIVQGAFAWWAAAVRGIEPMILSFGAAFAAIGLNKQSSQDVQLFAHLSEEDDKSIPDITERYRQEWLR